MAGVHSLNDIKVMIGSKSLKTSSQWI